MHTHPQHKPIGSFMESGFGTDVSAKGNFMQVNAPGYIHYQYLKPFLGGSVGKESASNAGDLS